MKKLLPLILALAGLAAGVAGGMVLKPSTEACDPAADPACATDLAEEEAAEPEDGQDGTASEFVELNRQFVVPLLRDGRVASLVVASLALEVDGGMSEAAFALEPKLRDVFLEVLFVHAHSGGFDGEFTAQRALEDLKGRLMEQAGPIVGPGLRDVLVTEIVRQDL